MTKYDNLLKLGVAEKYAWMAAMSRRKYWFMSKVTTMEVAITNERLVTAGYYDILEGYESRHSADC